jgi:CubicO group peptidase (beta-lactamase class C family)
MLRMLSLLGTNGVHDGRAILPTGWTREMARASRVSAGTGMQVARLSIDGAEALEVKDDAGSAFWVIPQRQLAILDITNPGGSAVDDLPGMLLKGIEAPAPAP